MVFNSFVFVLFLIPVLVFYYIMPSRFKWIILLISSICFYLSWESTYFLLLLFSILFDYIFCYFMDKTTLDSRRKIFLAVSVLFNIGLLFMFKYFSYFYSSFVGNGGKAALNLVIPTGISFFTFMKLAYVIDIYRKKVGFEKNIGIFALVCMFFPLVISGPIERATNMIKQYKGGHSFNLQVVFEGIEIFAWGVFKKLVIADRCAIFVNNVFSDVDKHRSLQLFIATIMFSIQIYCDFSGYSDMARGIAKMFDIDVMDNFRRPYFSKSIGEFWRRWHISLSSWFKDYLYIPLGGNRVARWRWYTNTMLVFMASGLWHGANVTFIVWGALHGLYLVWENSTKRLKTKFYEYIGIVANGRIYNVVNICRTCILAWFAWIFFRAASIQDAFYIIRHMFDWVFNITSMDNTIRATLLSCGLRRFDFYVLYFAVGLMFLVHLIQRREAIRFFLNRKPLVVRWAVYYVIMFSIMLFGVYNYAEKSQFIYGKF